MYSKNILEVEAYASVSLGLLGIQWQVFLSAGLEKIQHALFFKRQLRQTGRNQDTGDGIWPLSIVAT